MTTTTQAPRAQAPVSQPYADPAVEVTGGWVRRLLRYWPLTLVLASLGGVVGFGLAQSGTDTYTAEERIAVGYANTNLSAGATAGYATAAAQLASNYARYVNDEALAGTSAAGDVSVKGSPIEDSNVVRVIATSSDPDAAVAGARAASEQLVNRINSGAGASTPEAIFKEYEAVVAKWSKTNAAVSRAQSNLSTAIGRGADAGTINALSDQLASAQAANAEQELLKNGLSSRYQNALTTGGAAQLTVIQAAGEVSSDHRPRLLRYTLLGIGVGLLAALILASAADAVRERVRRRARSRSRVDSATL